MEQSLVWIKIIERIADREGIDPVDLDVPLCEVIDPDALETLTNGTGDRQPETNSHVEFSYSGYVVTVDESGGISIEKQPMEVKTDETEGVTTNDSHEAISAELNHRESVLRQTSEIIGDSNQLFDEQVSALLEVVREAVGTDYATLSYVDNDTYVFEAVDMPSEVRLQAGETVPLAELPNCKKVVEAEQTLVLKDVEAEAPELADHTWGISSYLGVPVFVDDEVYGTFCFYGMETRSEAFSDWDLTVVELLSNWVSGELEQRQQERALDAYSLEQPVRAD